MVTHSGILAWRIPWTEEPGGIQSVGLQRGGHDPARGARLLQRAGHSRVRNKEKQWTSSAEEGEFCINV